MIRIVDAAVINGDDVSSLPYDERMEAAEKMCLAVNCVHERAPPSAAAVMTANSKKRRARSMAPANPVLTAKVSDIYLVRKLVQPDEWTIAS